jgi:hypothetical protein
MTIVAEPRFEMAYFSNTELETMFARGTQTALQLADHASPRWGGATGGSTFGLPGTSTATGLRALV